MIGSVVSVIISILLESVTSLYIDQLGNSGRSLVAYSCFCQVVDELPSPPQSWRPISGAVE